MATLYFRLVMEFLFWLDKVINVVLVKNKKIIVISEKKKSFFECFPYKLCFEMKMTKLGVGHFTSISGHFFVN